MRSGTVYGFAIALFLASTNMSFADEPASTSEQYNHVLHKSSINNTGKTDVLIRELQFPPGWTAPTHFHNGDLFIYVISGQFEVTMEHNGTIIYSAGDGLEMQAKTIMDARNPSATDSLLLVAFQVGAPDSPFVVPVETE